ncbi:unnamed protein product [Cuscuta campestris]|uniref:C2H2-type domain-containing protein n=1 Tax=Cuscuta campestris TaxID=132261 RepID=A0A484NQV3_9ASTE|nr:unnamed protein product [Cuscuta campestris]
MDFSSQQQQQYQYWQLQSQSYDPSAYNYHHHQSYYYQQYPNGGCDYTNQQNAQQPQEKNHQHIHPPGVSDPSPTGLCAPGQENPYQLPAQQGSGDPSVAATMTYLTPGLQQGHQWYSQPDPYAPSIGGPGLAIGVGSQPYVLHTSVASQAPQKFGNRRGGRPLRGKSLHGKGHSQGRGVSSVSSSSITDASAGNNQQARVFRCEVCKADCTSLEVLEQHNHGKRHLKNMRKLELSKRLAEVQNGKKIVADPGKTQNSLQVEESKPGISIKPSQSLEHQAAVQGEDGKHELDNPDVPVPVEAPKVIDQRRGSKRAIRGGGRGGKRMRVSGPSSERGPPKPKVVIPLVCDLCNVKCDTQEVLDRHLSGKKHLSKRKHFEAHQAMYGPLELQVLYPPNPITQSLLQSQQTLSVPHETPEPSAPAAPLPPLTSQSQNTAP